VSYASRISALQLIALLFGGSAISQIGLAHSEGIEAADPSTPAALLRFEGAVNRYTKPTGEQLQWRALFDDRTGSPTPMSHRACSGKKPSGHPGNSTADSATMHQ
jgi:hypothetical protein